MFSTIDGKLILASQWTIRQIELYTSITRKNIGDMLLMAWKIIAIIFAILLLTFVALSIFPPASLSLDFINLFSIIFLYRAFGRAFIKSYANKENLPDEIVTRKAQRVFFLVWMCIIFLLMILGYAYYLIYPEIIENKKTLVESVPSYYSKEIYQVFFLVYLFTEYFLCTISLPPGEKEKKKVENEMRGLTPIPIR